MSNIDELPFSRSFAEFAFLHFGLRRVDNLGKSKYLPLPLLSSLLFTFTFTFYLFFFYFTKKKICIRPKCCDLRNKFSFAPIASPQLMVIVPHLSTWSLSTWNQNQDRNPFYILRVATPDMRYGA